MISVVILLSALLGIAIGSFLNVLTIRLPLNESIGGRSHCRNCPVTLRWFELIPLLSFCFQKGRCRSCGTVLSMQYPLVELSAALGYAVWASSVSSPTLLAAGFIAIAAAIVIIVVDLKYFIIPDGATLILYGVALFSILFRTHVLHTSVWWDIGAATVCFLFFLSLWFFSKGRWMGFGDVKLIGATSLILGFPLSIAALFLSFWTGAIIGIALLLLSRKYTMTSRIPFGPFILLGTALAYLLQPFLAAYFIW